MKTLLPLCSAAVMAAFIPFGHAQQLIFDPGTDPGKQSKPDQIFDYNFGDVVLTGSYGADTLAILSSGIVDSWKVGGFGVGGDWVGQTIMGEATPDSMEGSYLEVRDLTLNLPADVHIWFLNVILVFGSPWDDSGGTFALPIDLNTGLSNPITPLDTAGKSGVLTQAIFFMQVRHSDYSSPVNLDGFEVSLSSVWLVPEPGIAGLVGLGALGLLGQRRRRSLI